MILRLMVDLIIVRISDDDNHTNNTTSTTTTTNDTINNNVDNNDNNSNNDTRDSWGACTIPLIRPGETKTRKVKKTDRN